MDIDQHPNEDTAKTVVAIILIAIPIRLKHVDDFVVDDAAESPSVVVDDDGACSILIGPESLSSLVSSLSLTLLSSLFFVEFDFTNSAWDTKPKILSIS